MYSLEKCKNLIRCYPKKCASATLKKLQTIKLVPLSGITSYQIFAFLKAIHTLIITSLKKLSLDFNGISNILLKSRLQEFWPTLSVGAVTVTHHLERKTSGGPPLWYGSRQCIPGALLI